ncbi:DUF565 domain-containing protein [Pannus brasiliensis CCIBt3594]|uniref:DUF565 domain-containing protein n=1 Tax=Pannus brasiliensis CCIBt3594 TaxID=1427578 RepID=A0AAW9R1Q1_9CHRO
MQRTRLNTLADSAGDRLNRFFSNPWRRLSLQVISLLLGVFIGQAVSTTAGQAGKWDIPSAGLLLIFTELISRFFYRDNRGRGRFSLFWESLNLLKIGITYSLFLEAFKLGS